MCPEIIYRPRQAVTSSYTVQGRSLLRFTPCWPLMKYCFASLSLTHVVRVVPSGSHVPQIPKILLLGTNLLPSRFVHGANRVPRSLAKWNCCTAEFSECLEVSTLSRFTFFGNVAAPSHACIFRFPDATWEDRSFFRPFTRSDHVFFL